MPSRRRRRASPTWEGRSTITVATLPGRGLYARHLGHPEGVDAVHRTTVRPIGRDQGAPAFDRRWLSSHLADVDVVHVHGLPASVPAIEVSAIADTVRGEGTPLVVTGYHLTDPAGRDCTSYQAQLDALVSRADAVVTLTESAASEMRSRWGVQAQVLPHPHAVDFVRMRQERPRSGRGTFLIGLHLAALNLPVDPVELVAALTLAMAGLPDARLVVNLHETVLDPDAAAYAPGTVREIERLVRKAGGAVRTHRPLSEQQLWDHLFSLDVSVVPRLHGSHSVWPEACADLGTQVLLPTGSHASGQQPCLLYDDVGDVDAVAHSLHLALTTAHQRRRGHRSEPEQRWAERVRVAESLRVLYERLLGLDVR